MAVRDIDGPRSAVESAFSRLAVAEEILRVRKGIYWKGAATATDLAPPRIEEIALALGGPGSGPAEIAAAHWLGLTSQIPSIYLTAVPGRVPAPWSGIRFTQRPVSRLLRSLTASEVAILEVLRTGPAVVEARWDQVAETITRLDSEGDVRLSALDAAVGQEPHRQARARWADLRAAHPGLAPDV